MTKVSDLQGADLDYWVARALGHGCEKESDIGGTRVVSASGEPLGWIGIEGPIFGEFKPSTDWSQGGPIIDMENVQICPPTSPVHVRGGPNAGWGESGTWSATVWRKGPDGRRPVYWHVSSPLVAAMRAVVAAKFGEEVPDADQL